MRWTAFFAFALILGCEGARPSTASSPPVVLANADEVRFAMTEVGRSNEREVTVENAAEATGGDALVRTEGPFGVAGTVAHLGPGESASLRMSFKPTQPGVSRGALVLDAGRGELRIPLVGEACERGKCASADCTQLDAKGDRVPVPDGTACGPVTCGSMAECRAGACVVRTETDGEPCETTDACGAPATGTCMREHCTLPWPAPDVAWTLPTSGAMRVRADAAQNLYWLECDWPGSLTCDVVSATSSGTPRFRLAKAGAGLVVSKDHLLVGGAAGKVAAYRLDGSLAWQTALPPPGEACGSPRTYLSPSVAVRDGRVFVSARYSETPCYDEDGRTVVLREVDGSVERELPWFAKGFMPWDGGAGFALLWNRYDGVFGADYIPPGSPRAAWETGVPLWFGGFREIALVSRDYGSMSPSQVSLLGVDTRTGGLLWELAAAPSQVVGAAKAYAVVSIKDPEPLQELVSLDVLTGALGWRTELPGFRGAQLFLSPAGNPWVLGRHYDGDRSVAPLDLRGFRFEEREGATGRRLGCTALPPDFDDFVAVRGALVVSRGSRLEAWRVPGLDIATEGTVSPLGTQGGALPDAH